ncbi:MAG: hypothetical protein ACW967_11020, partial [Candidatus Hodarchaeales archaeon]
HRRYITHSPVFWVIIVLISYVFSFEIVFWFGFGCFLHLILDIIDWGIPYLPTKNSRLIPHLLLVKSTMNSEKDFSVIYWRNINILRLEQLFFLTSIFIIIVLFFNNTDLAFMYLFVLFFLFTSIVSIYGFRNSRKIPN